MAVLYVRDCGRDASALLGRVARRSGEIVTVVGAVVRYESTEWNEDCGDMSGGGWKGVEYVRLATPEEAAPILAAERAARERVEAEKTALANSRAIYAATRAAAIEGLVETRLGPIWPCKTSTLARESAEQYSPVLDRVDAAGDVWIREDVSRYDWDVVRWFASPDVVRAARLASARDRRLTRAYVAAYVADSGTDPDVLALRDLLTEETDTAAEASTRAEASARSAEIEARDEARYEAAWTAAQLAAPRAKLDAERRAAETRARALAGLTAAQRAALSEIAATGDLGARVTSSKAAQAATAVPAVVVRAPTLDALVRSALVRVEGDRAWAITT